MFCPECGAQNDDQAVFCENCGYRLADGVVTSPERESTQSWETSDFDYEDLPDDEEEAQEPRAHASIRMQLVVVVVALIAILACGVIYGTRFGAAQTAEKFAEAILEEDWNTAYSLLNVEEEGPFTTREAFVTAATVRADASAEETAVSVDVQKGDSTEEGKAYLVNLSLSGGETDSFTIHLKRSSLRWKIAADDFLSDAFTFSVPTGASVTVDKIEVPGEYLTGGQEGQDVYSITPIFGTTHYVEISGAGLTASAQVITSESGLDTQVMGNYSEAQLTALLTQAASDLQMILNGAAQQQDFSAVRAFSGMADQNEATVKQAYESLRDTGFGTRVASYTLSNMVADAYDVPEDEGVIQVEITGNYQITYGDSTQANTTGTCTENLYYINDSGTWKLYNMNVTL